MNKYNNVPVKKIDLKQWLKDHPSEAAKNSAPCHYYGIDSSNSTLNATQMAHLRGEMDIYGPVEAYTQKWFHKKDVYYPLKDTKKRNDLPPVYIQWKDDFRKRNARNKRNN